MRHSKIRKSIRMFVSALLITTASLGLVGCGSNEEKITNEDYNKLKESVTIGCGMTVNELEDTMVKFAYKVYSPQKEKDIADGIGLIKEISTEAEYKELLEAAGKYDETKETSIESVVSKYSPGKNNKDHMDRVYLEFNRTVMGQSKYIAIEFVINPNNKIFKHYIWNGSITNK